MNDIATTSPGAPGTHSTRDRIIVAVMIAVGTVLLVLLNGGRPRSLWFYPFMGALAIFVLVYRPGTYRANWLKGELGPVQPVSTALGRATIRGLLSGIMLYGIFELGSPLSGDVFLAAMFTFWSGSDEYRYRRGLPHTYWTMLVGLLGVLAVEFLLLDVFKVIHK